MIIIGIINPNYISESIDDTGALNFPRNWATLEIKRSVGLKSTYVTALYNIIYKYNDNNLKVGVVVHSPEIIKFKLHDVYLSY